MNEQATLFGEEKPQQISPNDLIQELKDERKLVDQATNLAREMIVASFTDYGLQLTTESLIENLVKEFGYGIRLHLFDISENLREERENIAEFTERFLSIDKLREALSGKDENQRTKDESTLDELFARTLEAKSSDKFKDVIKFVSALREYSPFNNMLVKLQRPNAKYYATASHWKKKFGRTIKDEAIPIVILRPMGPVMLVYDVDDTDGKPLPPQIEDPFSVKGNFNTDYFYQTILNCKKVNIEVKDVDLAKSHAGTAIRKTESKEVKLFIHLNKNHEVSVRYATLCHELAHIFLGHLGGDPNGKEWTSRIGLTLTQQELEAESVSYILCVRAGLLSNSDEYLSGYIRNEDDIKKISIEAIMKAVTQVEKMNQKYFRPRRAKKTENN